MTAVESPKPSGPTRHRSYKALEPTRGGLVLRWFWLSAAAVFAFFPFYAMVVLSLKPGAAVSFPESLLPWGGIAFDSYAQVLSGQNIVLWLFNTLVYSLVSVVAVLLFSAMAGYAFAKKRFAGKELMFWSFLAMVMVPFHVTLIPTFLLIANLGGVDEYWGLIVPTLANAQAVFLMRQFIQGLPDELFEAARIDGASEMRIFLRIVLPLCKPVLATLGIFVFLWHWNDFLWPLIVAKSNDMFTLTVGISSLQQQDVPLSVMLAGSVVALVPIFMAYLIAQRYVQEGVTGSGIKG
ncbi:carbohydrate ABC transporter permease [Microbacterium esteraromaticum]|uniref:Carbohydrate ABC transporter permease n=1 Tax=Microbacterium esteraromaticum TaxID=57043 RepID=A0A939IU99_9MICO|nr:carbohydrate ABC transporter permease [Microbacterium esteraromaticum]MBN8204804.1 carbohydrate ABC transporter permease [Microbacterium esteraromaticum]MBN8414958.1 carbohydrate ABC transporter permease [Microbacterium esteraromaticum]MBN8424768.1 carbohydrate ABC transporter permease [Microbacterium esteraromaticum]